MLWAPDLSHLMAAANVVALRQIPSGWSGCDHSRKADERRRGNDSRANDREIICQVGEGLRHLGDSMRRVVTGEHGGRDIDNGDHEPEPSRRHEGERELAYTEPRAARHDGHHDAAERAGPRVEGPKANRHACEDGQREDCEREEQPGGEADDEENEQSYWQSQALHEHCAPACADAQDLDRGRPPCCG